MSSNQNLEAALKYAAAGIWVFPCKDRETYGEDECKAPLTPRGFHDYSKDPEQIRAWWEQNPKAWIGVPTGKIHCIDIDVDVLATAYDDFIEAAYESEGMSDLIDMLVVQKTVSGGRHLLYRVEEGVKSLKNLKLARIPDGKKAFIETRGSGGYICVYPSEGYEVEYGDLCHLPVLKETERDKLISIATALDLAPKKEVTFVEHDGTAGGKRPGDDYGNRGEIPVILQKHGWTSRNGVYWTRPGKDKGISATWGKIPDRFYVFTSSTQFEPSTSYTPFAVFTILDHGGDYHQAAKALSEKGYGEKSHHDWRGEIKTSLGPCEQEKKSSPPDDKPSDIFEFLDSRAYVNGREVPVEPDIYTLDGVGIARAGNLGIIKAQPGVGKSSFLAACLAAPMAKIGMDTLRVFSKNPKKGAILHIDTEQSRGDHCLMVNRTLRRAGIEIAPDWFKSYCFTGLDYRKVKGYTLDLIKACMEKYGSIHSVWLDGIADMLDSPNNEEAANQLVTEMHDIAGLFSCPIWSVIHLNPGSMEKGRGHLGSQLERKSETVLTMDREDEIVRVWTSKRRKAGINKSQAVQFEWSHRLNMHVTKEFPGTSVMDDKEKKW